MCGFFGAVGEFNFYKAKKALNSLLHRGKDSQAIYLSTNLFLGHNRLYILNSSAPTIGFKNKKAVVLNGEIYNYLKFHPTTDTLAIPLAFPNLKALDGMFAFALLEGDYLYLVKDIFGKKPLYYFFKENLFLFASEIKAIERYLGTLEFDPQSLNSYLSFGSIPNSNTFYKGVKKLLGGEVLKLNLKTLKSEVFKFDSFKEIKGSFSSSVEEILKRSVKKRLQGDFEVAVLLSGGVDSSLLSALVKQEQGKVSTFSIGYPQKRYSELSFSKEVANHLKSNHYEIIFNKEQFLENLEEIVLHFDEPIGDSATIPLFYLLKKVKESGFKVVLSGEGADELFLGYRQYFEIQDIYKARELRYKNWLRNYFKKHFSPNREWELYKRAFSDEEIFRGSCEVFSDLQKSIFLKSKVNDSLEEIEEILLEAKSKDLWRFFTLVDLRIRLEHLYLKKLDMVSMAVGVEARTPFLDKELLERVIDDPQRALAPKTILKEVAKKYIPLTIIQRKKKGFSYPFMEWLKDSDFPAKMVKINSEIGVFKEDSLQFLIQSAKRNRFSRHFWLVFSFLIWFEKKFL
ncbi:MAG: asparagine synthase (glutamine-hydrolyzing) [Epsilonproteobacteria bacterium]|nr:asparagine synthase (glutamine-hydrolyzing) [Campylobacterota bacterium]